MVLAKVMLDVVKVTGLLVKVIAMMIVMLTVLTVMTMVIVISCAKSNGRDNGDVGTICSEVCDYVDKRDSESINNSNHDDYNVCGSRAVASDPLVVKREIERIQVDDISIKM